MDATLAPAYAIEVNGADVGQGITQFIERVEYESADGLADIARIRAINPDFLLSNAKVFQTGNELSIFMGYGTDLTHIGRVIITRIRPNWPQNGMPSISIVGYTKDAKMMNNAPPKSKKKDGKGGRSFKEVKYSDAVEERAGDYDFETKIDPSPETAGFFIQKAGLTDYDFVRGLSNLTGFFFWVDGEKDGTWTLHFRNPEQYDGDQDKTFTFQYNLGDMSSLLSFTPEMLLMDNTTRIQAQVKDPISGQVFKAEVEEESDNAPDVDATGAATEDLGGDHTTASDITLFLGEFSIQVVANRRFRTEAELIFWTQQWFRRQRENFVLARGRVIGVESLRARQTHNIEGVSSGLEGEYFFTKVKHIADKSMGYVCDFNARKVVP